MPFLIDTHCHIHFPAFDANRETVLAHLANHDIWAMTIGTGTKNSEAGTGNCQQQHVLPRTNPGLRRCQSQR